MERERAETPPTPSPLLLLFGAVYSEIKATSTRSSWVSNNRPQVVTLSQNFWCECFDCLVTLIYITKLDYCMQYKSFISPLYHAYIFFSLLLKTHIFVLRDGYVFINIDYKSPQKSITGFFRTQYIPRQDGDDDSAKFVRREKVLFKTRVKGHSVNSFAATAFLKVDISSRKGRVLWMYKCYEGRIWKHLSCAAWFGLLFGFFWR